MAYMTFQGYMMWTHPLKLRPGREEEALLRRGALYFELSSKRYLDMVGCDLNSRAFQ